MPFPSSHLLLTLHWEPLNVTGETGQVGIRFDSPHAATQARVDALAATLRTFWTTGGGIRADYGLKYARLARIGTDGRYTNASSYDYVFTDSTFGLAGGTSATNALPLQVATASTLTTAVPHGTASKGRIFLPPLSTAIGADYQWTAAQTNTRSAGVAAMLTSLGGLLGGPAAVFSKGTQRVPGGLSRPITGVKTGRRPDVQRRRAKAIVEQYGTTSSVSPPPRDAGPAEDGLIP